MEMESTPEEEQDGGTHMGTSGHRARLVFGLFCAIACGCGAYAVTPAPMPTLAPPKGAARICVIRRGSEGSLGTYPMRDNSILVGATVGGSCFCYFAASGHHDLESRTDGFDTLSLDAKPDVEYYVTQTTQAALGIVRSHLEVVDKDEGKAALEKCQYSVISEVPDGTYKAKPEAVVVAK